MDFPILLIVIIALALIFDYINGFHDAANSIATIVSTKVLTPFQAVLWAALWNFAAFFLAAYVIGEFKIGNTIAKTVNENFITLEVIFRTYCCYSMEPAYMVVWNSFLFITYSYRRFLRRCSYARFRYRLQSTVAAQPGLGFLIRSL